MEGTEKELYDYPWRLKFKRRVKGYKGEKWRYRKGHQLHCYIDEASLPIPTPSDVNSKDSISEIHKSHRPPSY